MTSRGKLNCPHVLQYLKNPKYIPVISKFYYVLTSEIQIDISIKIHYPKHNKKK
jgi:hypothetical protein